MPRKNKATKRKVTNVAEKHDGMNDLTEIIKRLQQQTKQTAGQPVVQPLASQPDDEDLGIQCDGSLEDKLRLCQRIIRSQQLELDRLYESPLAHATVVRATNGVNPDVFQKDDLCMVIDTNSPFYQRTGRLLSTPNKGKVPVMFPDLTRASFTIGVGKDEQQIKLLSKNDGTKVVIVHDGALYEVSKLPKHTFAPGDSVKVLKESRQIVDTDATPGPGEIVSVKHPVDTNYTEIEFGGINRIVMNGNPDIRLRTEDRVLLDKSGSVIIRHLGRSDQERYKLRDSTELVTWDDIGGCDEAKRALINAIELPYKHPEIHKFYNKRQPRGVLIYGPPGNGKTMLGSATASGMAKVFGKEAVPSAFIYVKGPEILSKWVGQAEANLRELFARADEHYEQYGYPAVIFIDEAEAILPERGKRRSSDIDQTLVPMWLSLTGGIDQHHAVAILATNRQKLMDQAAIRLGRLDCHIKVGRPDLNTCADIMKKKLRNVPLCEVKQDAAVAMTVAEVFSKKWQLYSVTDKATTKKYTVTMGDLVSGALITSVVEGATNIALERDLADGKHRGVRLEDLLKSVKTIAGQQYDQTHVFDLEDYCDAHSITEQAAQIQKLHPKAVEEAVAAAEVAKKE